MTLIRNFRAAELLWIVGVVCLLGGIAVPSASAAYILGIRVEPTNQVMVPDQEYAYRAFADYSDNTSNEITTFATWTTSSSAIARVSNEPGRAGVVLARGPGDVKISATFYYFDDNNKGSANLAVDAGSIIGIRTKPTTKSLEVGKSENFTARLMYESGYDVDISERVQWSSSTPAIAAVIATNPQGATVSAYRVGTTTITAYDPETGLRNLDGDARIRARVTHIDFEESAYLLGRNMRLPLRVYAYRTDGTRTQITDDVTFQPTAAGVVRVTEGSENPGLILPLREGTVAVDAFDPERELYASASLGRTTIRVAGNLEEILVEPLSVRIGDSRNAHAYGKLSTGDTTTDLRRVVVWRSLNPSIATIKSNTGSPGEISGLRLGTTTIIATDSFTGISSLGLDNLEVRAPTEPVEPIVRLRTKPTTKALEIGEDDLFTARGVYLSGDDTDISDRVRWSSSAPQIASVIASGPNAGLVSGHQIGTCTITAYDPQTGLSSTDGTTTVRAGVTHIDFEAPQYVLGGNMYLPLRVYAYRTDGTRFQITDDVGFEIQTDGIVSIIEGGNDAGRITARGTGTVTVDAIDSGRGLRASDSLGPTTIRVEGALREVLVEPLAITVGESRNARVHGLLSTGAVTSDLRRVVNWATDDPSIATVSNAAASPGAVTGLRTGLTSLVATENSTGISSLQNNNLEIRGSIESIEIEPGSLRLGIGLRYPMRAYGRRSDGSRSNITSTVVWSATNDSAASIDDDGWVQAEALGQSTVQAFHPSTGLNATGAPARVTVAGSVASLEIAPMRVDTGNRRKAKVRATLSDGSETDDLRPALEWRVDDATIARVGSAENPDLDPGEVEGLSAGWTTLEARDPVNGWVTSSLRNLKIQGSIVRIAMEAPDRGLVGFGTQSQFKVRATFEDSETLNISDKCEWSTDAAAIASVTNEPPAKGIVSGHRAGETTTIRANCSGLTATLEVVVLGESTGLRFGNNRSRFSAYRSYRFRAYAEYPNDQIVEVTREAAWVLTNEDVAEFDPREPGRVNFLDSGTTFLVAAYENGFFAIVELTVSGGVETMRFTPQKVTIRGGTGRRLRLTGSLRDGRGEITMTRYASLESSDENIVRLAPTDKEPGRILTGGTTGTATITATTSSGVEAKATIRVREALQSLELTARRSELESGELGRFRVLGIYQNGKRRYLTRYAVVTSSEPSIVGVEEKRGSYGRMYAQRPGEVQLQAKDLGTGITSAPVTIRVTRQP
jgi:uncharacterized protein YjdB